MADEIGAPEIALPLLRQARTGCHMTLQEVSDAVGLSVTHLSRLESGKRQPSVGILMQLARLYGKGVGELLGEDSSARHHLTTAEQRVPRPGPDGPIAVLTGLPDLRGLHAVELTLDGDDTVDHVSSHGDEEVIYVLSGAIRVTLGDEALDLAAGDSLHFDARVDHRLTERDHESRVLIVCAPLQTAHARPHASPVARGR